MSDAAQLSAPREHGERLVAPSLDHVADLLADAGRAHESAPSLLGRPLAELRALARTEALAASCRAHAVAGESEPTATAGPWVLAGHQPELFHPGVWFKNFLLADLAQRTGGFALNVVVDNDVPKSNRILAPAGERFVEIPVDRDGPPAPYEELPVRDAAYVRAFPARVAEVARAWPFRPWLDEWTPAFASDGPAPLGERVARLRRRCERVLGLTQAEVPLSALCDSEAFAWFACALLDARERFASAFGDAIAQYRRRHRLRSRNHPFPELERRADRVETPFWVWRPDAPARRRLFVTPDAAGVTLWAEGDVVGRLRGPASGWPEQWPSLRRAGWKIRTRAATTTLFCRLMLADLFVHGLGGGKYDEATDAAWVAYAGSPAPPFVVATATWRLPLAVDPGASASFRAAERALRDLRWNPERHVAVASDLRAARAEALALPQTTHAERVRRFARIRETLAALAPRTGNAEVDARAALAAAERRVREYDVASSRAFAFVLHPLASLEALAGVRVSASAGR